MTLRRRFVEKVLPLATSVALHAGVVAVAMATYQAVKPRPQEPNREYVPSISEGVVDGRELPRPITRDLQRSELLNEPTDSVTLLDASQNKTMRSVASLGFGSLGGADETSLFIGASASGKHGPRGFGGESSDGSGPNFGARNQTGGTFFPPASGTPARTVAFVCDASGSMTATFGPLKHEIVRYVDALKPNQAFNVIFFQESTGAAIDKNGLLLAKPEAKRRAYTFLDGITPRGQTNPVPALELAFKQRPALIYLLTDGDFPDNAAVLRLIREKNSEHRTKINTIAFVARGDTYEKVLKTIARENDGVFRYVSEDDLKR
jgi:hypothetical protein